MSSTVRKRTSNKQRQKDRQSPTWNRKNRYSRKRFCRQSNLVATGSRRSHTNESTGWTHHNSRQQQLKAAKEGTVVVTFFLFVVSLQLPSSKQVVVLLPLACSLTKHCFHESKRGPRQLTRRRKILWIFQYPHYFQTIIDFGFGF